MVGLCVPFIQTDIALSLQHALANNTIKLSAHLQSKMEVRMRISCSVGVAQRVSKTVSN